MRRKLEDIDYDLKLTQELSPRDLALSALICTHQAVRVIDMQQGDERLSQVGRQAWALLTLMVNRIGTKQDRLWSACYGLPSYLIGVNRADSGGLGGFIFRLHQCLSHPLTAHPIADGWIELCLECDISTFAQLEDLTEFHGALQACQPEATWVADQVHHHHDAQVAALDEESPVESVELRAEVHRRLRRFDIPVTLTGGGGVVVSATLSLDRPRGQPVVIGADPEANLFGDIPIGKELADRQFFDGVKAGLEAAKGLLTSYGLGILGSRLDAAQVCLGAVPIIDIPFTMGSAGLPVALAALEVATNLAEDPGLRLPRPSRRLTATGVIQDNRIVALSEGIAEKSEAVRAERLSTGLLVLTTDSAILGVEQIGHNAITAKLEDAAEIWWGHQIWENWCEKAQEVGIGAQGFTRMKPEDFERVADSAKHVVTQLESSLIESVLTDVRRENSGVWVVAGYPQSGKTHIAFGLTMALEAAGIGVAVRMLSANRRDDLDADALDIAWRIATAGWIGDGGILILDNAEWLGQGIPLGEVLESFAKRAGVGVVAFVRSHQNTPLMGQAEDVRAYDSIAQYTVRLDFAQAAGEQNESLRAPANLLGSIVRYAGPDLWLLMRLLESTTEVPLRRAWDSRELTSRVQEIAEAFAERIIGLSDRQRESLARIAALSILYVDAPAGLVDPKDRPALADYLDEGPSGLKIPSRAAAHAIAARFPQVARSPVPGVGPKHWSPDDVLRNLIVAASRHLLKHDPATVPGMLASVVHRDSALGSRVMEAIAVDLTDAAKEWTGRPALVARALRLVERYASARIRHGLAESLARDVIDSSADSLSPMELAVSLREIDRYREHLERQVSARHPRGLLASVMDAFSGYRLHRVLGNSARPAERRLLLPVLRRLYESQFVEIVKNSAEEFVACPPPWTANDLWAVLATFSEFDRWRVEGYRFEPLSLPIVERMLVRPPGSDLRSYLAWLALNVRCCNYSELEKIYLSAGREIELRLHGDIVSLFDGLTGISDIDRRAGYRLTRELLDANTLEDRVRSRLPSMSTIDMARTIHAFSRLNPVGAWRVVSRDATPRTDLASAMAREIAIHPDPRGLGKLLYRLAVLDRRFARDGIGFGNLLAETVGISLIEAMLEDTRGRVVFHLVRSLLDVQASYLSELLDQVLDRLEISIVNSTEEYAPFLLVSLCTDTKLAERRDLCADAAALPGVATNLANRMLNCSDEVALLAFHRLGALLEPELQLAASFGSKFLADDSTYTSLLRRDSPLVLLRAANAVLPTLHRAGFSLPGKEAFAKAVDLMQRHSPWWLEGRVKPEHMPEILRLMRRLDEEAASAFVTDSREVLVRCYEDLVPRIMACDLVSEISKLDPSVTSEIAASTKEGSTRRLTKSLVYESEPMRQAIAIRTLSNAIPGVMPSYLQREVLNDWLAEMRDINQPVLIADRLRVLASWNRDWAHEAARRVDWRSVSVRVGYGQPNDLDSVAALAGCADALDLTAYARDLLAAATKRAGALGAMQLNSASRLLGATNALAPDIAKNMAPVLVESFVRHVARQRIIEPHKHMMAMGWCARHLRDVMWEIPEIGGPPASISVGLVPAVRLWGTLWLRREPWRDEIFHDAMAEALAMAATLRSSWAAATILIALCCESDSNVSDIEALAEPLMAVASNADPGLLSVLIDCTANVQPVQRQLEQVADQIVETYSAARWATNTMARRLVAQLKSMYG